MVYGQHEVENLRELLNKACDKVFGTGEQFLDFLEKNKNTSDLYDCLLDSDGENYIINRVTGQYINWYKFYHLGRSVQTTVEPDKLVEFLSEFKRAVEIELETV